MMTTTRNVARAVGFVLLAAGIASSLEAGPRRAMPHSGGAGTRAAAPRHGGGSALRAAPARRPAAPQATARGVARYGYHRGGSTWIGYPYWGGGYPWWGGGWYGAWGWPGYGYPGYGPWYAPADNRYIVAVNAPEPRGPAIVETGVSPADAEVLLDGESVGFASDYNGRWDELSVTPGRHTIAFRADGYRTLVVEFDARPGATYVFRDELVAGDGEDHRTVTAAAAAPQPSTRASAPTPTGRLRVRVAPNDAAVYLDGEYLGTAAELARIHGALVVATGSHRLEAVRPGYVSAMRTIDVDEADLATVELTLEPER